SSAVAFITAHEDPSKEETALDWAALAAFPGTLVFYMGVRTLEAVTGRLIQKGRPPEEPAAVIERGTLPGQRVVAATLGEIANRATAAEIRPPALTVIGSAVALREKLDWLHAGPLHGRRVVITRARPQASGLAAPLSELGGGVVGAPARKKP